MAPQLALSLSRNEVTGRVLKVSATTCQAVPVVGAPAGVTVQLFRMGQVTTTTGSYQGAVVGKHYDPLTPVTQACAADAFLWADIAVAAGVAPGAYSFTVGGLPVALKVWNLTMPATPSMALHMGLDPTALVRGHGIPDTASAQAPVIAKYVAMLRAHRIEPYGQPIAEPSVLNGKMNLDNYSGDGGSYRQLVMNGAIAPVRAIHPSPIGSGWYTTAQLQAWDAAIKAEPTLANAFAYITDEPASDEIAGTATRAKLVRQYVLSAKTMVTTEPRTELLGLIDHFTVVFEEFKTANHWTDYSKAPGYWLYGSCMSHGNCSNGAPGGLTGSPDLMLDHSSVQGRAFPLVAYALGAQAALYYQSVMAYYGFNTWDGQYLFGGNGDGNLFYPAIAGKPGFTEHGPVASIRLKALRQGLYDVEYAKLAAQWGMAANIGTLITSQFAWSKKNADYDALREQIGNALGK